MRLLVSGDTGAGKLALNTKIAGGVIIPLFSLILSVGGEPSVQVPETVGNASLNFLSQRGLAHTAESVLVCGFLVEDEECLDPLSCYSNASSMLGCLRTAWKHQY